MSDNLCCTPYSFDAFIKTINKYKKHVTPDRIESIIAHNSFRWRAIRLFNSLPKSVRNITDAYISMFKQSLHYFLRTLRDSPT